MFIHAMFKMWINKEVLPNFHLNPAPLLPYTPIKKRLDL